MPRTLLLAFMILAPAVHAQQSDLHTATRPTIVRTAPSGETSAGTPVGQLARGTTVEVIARERGWVRVRLEGWVRESDLIVSDSTLRPLSAADIRSDPARSRGKLVRWAVEAVSLQVADPLRSGLQPGEPYLLALGPGNEKALVYIAVPASLLPTVRSLPPLAPVMVTARVRNGRSEPAGVPVLDLQSITRR